MSITKMDADDNLRRFSKLMAKAEKNVERKQASIDRAKRKWRTRRRLNK